MYDKANKTLKSGSDGLHILVSCLFTVKETIRKWKWGFTLCDNGSN